jgi:hypothetical protein
MWETQCHKTTMTGDDTYHPLIIVIMDFKFRGDYVMVIIQLDTIGTLIGLMVMIVQLKNRF